MKAVLPALALLACALAEAGSGGLRSFEACEEQDRFDIMMCKSHTCTDCILEWCMEKCQEIQLDFPGCRCSDWPTARKSFSAGDFKGKGKFGDVGDYSK
mmetsp:Transcript_43826/g.135767  ORF Transcript_43826/g.135767 Transcript_43826/m.135767 type:complete len:99 (+) Transcript_43826:108-404(+)